MPLHYRLYTANSTGFCTFSYNCTHLVRHKPHIRVGLNLSCQYFSGSKNRIYNWIIVSTSPNTHLPTSPCSQLPPPHLALSFPHLTLLSASPTSPCSLLPLTHTSPPHLALSFPHLTLLSASPNTHLPTSPYSQLPPPHLALCFP